MLPIATTLPEGFLLEEERAGYIVSAKMKKIWAVEIDLMENLLDVCKKNEIEIFVSGGTMLGAVRHHGMIPWDDDIDLVMRRNEYERLCSIAKEEFSHPYFFQTTKTDKRYYKGFARLRNSETTGILDWDKNKRFNHGIFIDIFPLDNFPDNPEERVSYLKEIEYRNNKVWEVAERGTFYPIYGEKNVNVILRRIVKRVLYGFLRRDKIDLSPVCMEREKAYQKYNGQETEKVILSYFFNEKQAFFKEDLKSVIWMDFEWLKVPVPIGYEHYLESVYGNWKKYVIGGSLHGEVFFDPERPYSEYLK